jgi:uncharacterized protein (DUF1810 family)
LSDGLERFRRAQDEGGAFARALAEIAAGRKRSHWMWFVFPQIAGLGLSSTARFYAIRDRAEARAYLADPVLRDRLLTITAAARRWAGVVELPELFGAIDALKFVSSMTLFEAASDQAGRGAFADALDALAGGQRDERTLAILSAAE